MSAPKLRFKEFDGDWSLTTLNQLSTKIGDGIHATPKYDESGTIPFINGNNLVNGRVVINENTKRISNEEFQKYNQVLSDRTLFLSINGTIGNLAFYKNEKVLLGISVCFINLKNDLDKKFIYLLLQSPQLTKTLNSELTGTTIKNLSLATVRNSEFYCPIEAEQTKIASFLSAVDEKISQLTQKHQLLSQYKQGMMQKLFSQQIRFKADDGSEFGEWEETRVKDIFDVTRGYVLAVSKTVIVADKEYKFPVFSSQTKQNGLMGFYKEYLFEDAITWTTDGANAGEVNFRKGKFYCTNVCGVLKSEKGYANYCIAEILNRVTRKYVSYVGNPKLMNNVMSEIPITIPRDIEEQTKIANFLSTIDQKIEVVAQQIEQAKQWKKGLLQQMFV